ncbi:Uncharacterised protein [Bordetella pertussis]|nr:Uncharacterised protein [Bordetella pertussis]
MKFRNIVGAALCAAFALGVAPAQAQNYKSEYKLSIVVGTTFPWGQGAVIWSDLVRERTGGPHQYQGLSGHLAGAGRPDP